MTQRSPSLSTTASPLTVTAAAPTTCDPHDLECRIQRGLQTYPGLKFLRLTVHQCTQGVCLEGVLESNETGLDLCDVVNTIAGVKAINHVVAPRAK